MVARAVIEATVVVAVEAVLAGGSIEDERIECKSELIQPDKARQLAGSANAALGEDIIWIVGLDEKAKRLVPLDDSVDLADWWTQVSRRFDDGVAPDLTSLRIAVTGGTVLALHFKTDRAPYVVRHPTGGSPELEVPWRDGTRTRSAKRHELLKILLPTIRVPSISLLSCGGSLDQGYGSSAGKLIWRGEIWAYVEHAQANVVPVMPNHVMKATLRLLGGHYPLRVAPIVDSADGSYSGGIEARQDGVYCKGPGEMRMTVYGSTIDIGPETPSQLQTLSEVQLRLELGVVGAARPVRLSSTLRSTHDSTNGPTLRLRFEMASQS